MFRKSLLLMTLFVTMLAVSACGVNFSIGLFTADENVGQSFTVNAAPNIVVEMFNGGIDVATGSSTAPGTVTISVTKRGGGNTQADAQNDLKNVEVTMTQEGNTIRVVAQRTDRRVDIGNSGASAKLTVPKGSTFDLRTSNGGITTAGPAGDVKAESSNGGINVRGALGQLDLTTSNAGIGVDGGSGTLRLETSNGGIDATTSEPVTVNARSSNGSVHFTGPLSAGHSELDTSNAGIVVTLPAQAGFSVNADTSNGRVTSDFPVSGGSRSDTQLRGTVGSESATVLGLHTSNGNIDIRQGH